MNRKQRRHVVKSNPSPKELTGILKREEKANIEKTVDLYSVAVAYVLFSKQGFEKDRLAEAMNQIVDVFDSFNQDYLTFVDMRQVLEEEADFVVSRTKQP